MYTITVYEGEHPHIFTGQSENAALGVLRNWMNANNGEKDNPQHIDGLVCKMDLFDYPETITLFRDPDGWRIAWDDEPDGYYRTWSKACAAFLDACYFQIVNPCQECKSSCRFSFPACEVAR